MKSFFKTLCKKIATMLPAVALFFAVSPCVGKIYEPKLPEQLK